MSCNPINSHSPWHVMGTSTDTHTHTAEAAAADACCLCSPTLHSINTKCLWKLPKLHSSKQCSIHNTFKSQQVCILPTLTSFTSACLVNKSHREVAELENLRAGFGSASLIPPCLGACVTSGCPLAVRSHISRGTCSH